MEKTQILERIEGRRSGWQALRWLDGITDSMDMNLSRLPETERDRGSWCGAVQGVALRRTRPSGGRATTSDVAEARSKQ